jgi:two-component system cell cycle response regulator CtrA
VRILLVENDKVSARGISQLLSAGGAVVDRAGTGDEAIQMARRYDYDIMLLDLALPGDSGFDVVRRLRAARNGMPVLALPGRSRPDGGLRALGAGADDFISKPFDRAELLARIHAIVRRSKGFAQNSLRVGTLQLDLDSHEVSVDGRPVALTSKLYSMLELMMLRKGAVMAKEAFLNHLYGGMNEPCAKIVDVFMCKLRKKLAEAGADGLIVTVWGRGYTLREPSGIPAPCGTGMPDAKRVAA